MKWVLIGIVVLVVLVALWAVFTYNSLVKLRNLVQEAWHQIDVELKRRHDLIPNLVETVKGYAAHERGTLEEVIRARAAAVSGGSTPAAAAAQENVLTQALGRLMAIAEAYPDLKANQNFLALQSELAATEDRIAAGRRYYNANVRALNTKIETVPTNLIAGFGNFTKAEYFEVEGAERETPNVSFGAGTAAGGPGGTPPAIDSASPMPSGSVTGQAGAVPPAPQQPQQPQQPTGYGQPAAPPPVSQQPQQSPGHGQPGTQSGPGSPQSGPEPQDDPR